MRPRLHRIQARNLITLVLAGIVFAEVAIFKDPSLFGPALIPIILGGIAILVIYNMAWPGEK